jgi:hypothetical protein
MSFKTKIKTKKIFFVIIIILIVIFNEFYTYRQPNFVLQEDSTNIFAKLPGTIKIKIISGDKCLIYSLYKGKMSLEQTLPFPPNFYEKRPYNHHFMEDAVTGPAIHDHYYHGPYSFNQEKSLVVFSLSYRTNDTSPTQFVLVNWETRQIVFKNSYEGNYIEDIIWSKDSEMFAVLETKPSGPLFSILAILSSISGHPTRGYKYFLSIYNRQGLIIVKSIISKKVANNSGQLFWN